MANFHEVTMNMTEVREQISYFSAFLKLLKVLGHYQIQLWLPADIAAKFHEVMTKITDVAEQTFCAATS